MSGKRGLTVLEFAKREGKTLDWIYKQCRLGKLPATLHKGRWIIYDRRPRSRSPAGKNAQVNEDPQA
jgi:hypothetical protein